ncbi:hypothetical protein [Rothia halotolerans]|uniref:hypothetical protein n=1 Tax=Rothia halotolerans TaxID=405770 RepID=UPI00101D3963|nr:hypothetical protein [Rothia halotolerans]
MSTNRVSLPPPRWFILLVAFPLIFIPLLLAGGVLGLIIWAFLGLDEHGWSVAGEITRNVSGVATLVGALITVWMLNRTNRARAREAASANFREQMQWAAERIYTEDEVAQSFALAIIDKYAEQARLDRGLLSSDDKAMALEMQWVADNITNPETLENIIPRDDDEDISKEG